MEAFLIVALFLAPLLLPAFGRLASQSSSPATPQSPSSPLKPPPLTAAAAKEVAADEKAIHDALSQVENVSVYDSAIPKAQRVLEIRISQQGDGWWETIDARNNLRELRQFSDLTPDQRTRLVAARQLADQIATLRKTGPLAQAIALQLKLVKTEEQVLGDDDLYYAASLSLLGEMYVGMGEYEQAEPVYKEAWQIRQAVLGDRHPIYARSLSELAQLYQLMGRYDQAEALCRQSLEIQRTTIGEDQADYAIALDTFATINVATGRDEQGEKLYRQAMEIEKKTVGDQSPIYATTLCNLGDLYRWLGRYSEAETLQLQALAIRKKAMGETDPDYARSLDRLAALYDSMGRYVQAEPLYKQALEIRKNALGEDHPDYARSLNNLAFLYKEMGRYPEAEPLYLQALAIRKKVFGEQHRTYASSLDDLAQLYQAMGEYEKAETLYKQALEIRKNALGVKHPAYAVNLDNLALLYEAMGRYKDAETFSTQALQIRKETIGEHNPGYAKNLCDLAQIYQAEGHYELAEPMYKQALEIQKGTVGEVHSDYATSVDSLASLYVAIGQDDVAETLYLQALQIEKQALGEQHPLYATTLCNLGDLYRLMGRYAQAEPLYVRSLDIRQKALGEDHPDYARSLDRLAALYDSMGRYPQAEPLYKQAIDIRKKSLGEEHPDYARSLNNLALLYKEMNRYQESESLYLQALAIRKKVFGDQHRTYASSLDDLAQLYTAMHEYDKAEPLYKQALEIRKKTLGEEHPAYAVNLDNLSLLYEAMDRYPEAEALCRQALEIRKKTIGVHHPQYAANLRHLASILEATNRTEEASQLLLESAQLQWQHLTENFPTMSNEQKREFLSRSRFVQSEELSSLVFEGKGVDPKQGLAGVLLSKELLFEVARQESGALLAAVASAPPDWQAAWRKREKLRHEYANVALLEMSDSSHTTSGGVSLQDRLHSLAQQIETLDEQLRRTNPAYAAQAPLQMVTVEDVSAGLRPGEALLEYVEFRPRDFCARKWGNPHYGVFILMGGTGQVTAVDLGSAAAIDKAVEDFRTRMSGSITDFGSVEPSTKQVRDSEGEIGQSSAALRALIWDPIEKQLTRVKRVYVAPDGMLSLIPFEALAVPDKASGWRYLAEDREIVYLGTGRDLARLTLSARSATAEAKTAVLVSDPDFDASQARLAAVVAGVKTPTATIVVVRPGTKTDPKPTSAGLGTTLSAGTRCQLPATWLQGPVEDLDHLLTSPVEDKLTHLGWSVTTLTHTGAVEEAVLDVRAPSILQFATHGYYLDCPASSEGWDNPLLRSGMVMAGVNTWPKEHAVYYHVGNEVLTAEQARERGLSDDELNADRVVVADGILTAYEVSGMNLQGTELVNLTACETGLGEVTPDGVAGLRQAFLLAGARSLTMSMWEVPAEETGEEVSGFYLRWLLGTGRAARSTGRYEAFRSAQLAALQAARKQHGGGHPFYWAGVVYVGDPGGLPTGGPPKPVQPTPRAAQ